MKRMHLARGQEELAEIDAEALEGVGPPTSAGWTQAVVSSTVFGLLSLAGVFVRLEAGTADRPSILLFQALVPIAAALVEYMLHDPTWVPRARQQAEVPGARDTVSTLWSQREQVEGSFDRQILEVMAQYAYARDILRLELIDRGFTPNRRAG
jgi:hypothetical protein